MDLLLLRHGIAEDQKPGGSDFDRALTGDGRRRLREVLEVARSASVEPSLIVSSPLKRARETAEVAADVMRYKGDVILSKSLTPDSNPEEVWQEIRGFRSESSLLLVGHEPLFSHLGGYLLGAPGLQIEFKKGGLMCLAVDRFPPQPRGVLSWYLTPKISAKRE